MMRKPTMGSSARSTVLVQGEGCISHSGGELCSMAQLLHPGWQHVMKLIINASMEVPAAALATAAAGPVIAAGERALSVVGDWWGW